jgi:phage terminase large subunit-like protein
VSSYPQTDSRLIPASKRLHDAVVDHRLTHPDHPALNEHVASAVTKHSRRGLRLDRADRPIDGIVALCMALDRAEQPAAEPVRLIGWL